MGGLSNGTFGLVIAGGRSRRMGQDKAALTLGGLTLLERASARLSGLCDQVAVSVSRPSAADPIIERLGLWRVVDLPGAPEGPLSGVLAGLLWARAEGAACVVTLPCDVPFPPDDLIARLLAAASASGCAVARTPDGPQSLCSVWSIDQIPALEAALAAGRHPPVRAMLEAAGAAFVDYDDPDLFQNLNTPDDLAAAQTRRA
jgi:molybdopterin-guanine dinucleotide biosynthesis protein A